jgi:hypothetical protein
MTDWTYPIRVDHPLAMESGIYFDMPEDRYHGALALSSSGIRNMRISTLDFWVDSVLNPTREERDTIALRDGRAYDKRIVEGREVFEALYAPELDPADHPKALRTNEQLIAALDSLGFRVPKTTRKAELIAKLADVDPTVEVWEAIKAEHDARYPNREFLPAETVRRIEIAAAMIDHHPQLRRAFTGGLPQVSVFWVDEDTGVPLKCRFDYLKPLAIVDLKSYANMNRIPVRRAIANAVANHAYHVQAALYLRGGFMARQFATEGRVFGEVDRGFVTALAEQRDPHTFMFVFQQKGPAPVARGMVLGEGSVLDIARIEIGGSLRKFAECWMAFGAEAPWVDISDIDTFDHLEFPAYLAAA